MPHCLVLFLVILPAITVAVDVDGGTGDQFRRDPFALLRGYIDRVRSIGSIHAEYEHEEIQTIGRQRRIVSFTANGRAYHSSAIPGPFVSLCDPPLAKSFFTSYEVCWTVSRWEFLNGKTGEMSVMQALDGSKSLPVQAPRFRAPEVILPIFPLSFLSIIDGEPAQERAVQWNDLFIGDEALAAMTKQVVSETGSDGSRIWFRVPLAGYAEKEGGGVKKVFPGYDQWVFLHEERGIWIISGMRQGNKSDVLAGGRASSGADLNYRWLDRAGKAVPWLEKVAFFGRNGVDQGHIGITRLDDKVPVRDESIHIDPTRAKQILDLATGMTIEP